GTSARRRSWLRWPASCFEPGRATSLHKLSPSMAASSARTPHGRTTMAIKYYHAEPLANSLKSMVPLFEKGLAFQSVYVDLHKFEQHSDWFVAINPEGQVPVLDHDGRIITHTTVINEYLEDVYPEIPLRPRDALS